MTVTGFTLNDGSTVTNTGTATGTVPACSAGDVLVVEVSENTSTATYSIAGGGTGITWNLRSGPDDNSSNERTYLWTATAVADSGGSTVTVTSTANGRMMGSGAVVTGVTETGALEALTSQTTSGTSEPFPSVTIPDASGWTLLGIVTMRVGTTTAPSLTAPTGSTLKAQSQSAYTTQPSYTSALVSVNSTVGSGSQSPGTGTASASTTNSQLYTLALAPGIRFGSFSLSGSGSMSFTGVAKPIGSLAQTGSGSMSFTGVAKGVGALAQTGSGSLSLVGLIGGTLARTGSGSLSFSGLPKPVNVLAQTGSGSMSFTVKPIFAAVLARTGSGSLSLVGLIGGTLVRTGSGTVVFAGHGIFRHNGWTGSAWVGLTPEVWSGSAWLTIPVTIAPSDVYE